MKRFLETTLLVCLFVVAASWTAFSLPQADPLGGTGGGPIQGSITVHVVHDGTVDPVAGAFVMVGSSPDRPFAGNWGFTASGGTLTFVDPALEGPIAVTAGAPGHRYFTVQSVDAADVVIALKPAATSSTTYEVGDYVSGIDVDNGLFNIGDGNVDMAFVLEAFSLEEIMSFDLEGMLGPPETIDVLGNVFEVPSNVFVPKQYELFTEIKKDHYYLYLPAGEHTLAALSGRIALSDLSGGGGMTELIPLLDWREIDFIDATVTGDLYTADLNVDPDLLKTVTLNLANVPEDSVAWCISAGDLEALHGLGTLVPLGLNTLDCPAGSGPCSGSVTLTTTAASGKFAGMDYFPAVAVQLNATEDVLILMDRTSHPQSYTADLDDFFELLDLAYTPNDFAWNDVENPASGSPGVDLLLARIKDPGTGEVYWEFMMPGDTLSFSPPALPPQAPPAPSNGTACTWEQLALALRYDLASFDYDQFAFSDIPGHASHLAIDAMGITWQSRRLVRQDPDGVKIGP